MRNVCTLMLCVLLCVICFCAFMECAAYGASYVWCAGDFLSLMRAHIPQWILPVLFICSFICFFVRAYGLVEKWHSKIPLLLLLFASVTCIFHSAI